MDAFDAFYSLIFCQTFNHFLIGFSNRFRWKNGFTESTDEIVLPSLVLFPLQFSWLAFVWPSPATKTVSWLSMKQFFYFFFSNQFHAISYWPVNKNFPFLLSWSFSKIKGCLCLYQAWNHKRSPTILNIFLAQINCQHMLFLKIFISTTAFFYTITVFCIVSIHFQSSVGIKNSICTFVQHFRACFQWSNQCQYKQYQQPSYQL